MPSIFMRGALAALLVTAALSIAHAQTPAGQDAVLAKVNGVEIRQSDLNAVEEEAGQIPPMAEAQKRDYLIAFLTDMILVSKAADEQKLADTEEYKQKLDFACTLRCQQRVQAKTGFCPQEASDVSLAEQGRTRRRH